MKISSKFEVMYLISGLKIGLRLDDTLGLGMGSGLKNRVRIGSGSTTWAR